MKKKIPQLFLSSCLSYWLFITFLPENQLSLAKNFNSLSVCVEKKKKKKKKITTPVSPPDRDFSELSPRKWPPPAFLLMPAFLGSVWTTNGGELVNCHCSNNAASLCEKASVTSGHHRIRRLGACHSTIWRCWHQTQQHRQAECCYYHNLGFHNT